MVAPVSLCFAQECSHIRGPTPTEIEETPFGADWRCYRQPADLPEFQTNGPIGTQKEDPTRMAVVRAAPRAGAVGGAARVRCCEASGLERSGPVLEPPALGAGLDDVAVMGQAVEEWGGHLGVAEHARPLAKGQVGVGDH